MHAVLKIPHMIPPAVGRRLEPGAVSKGKKRHGGTGCHGCNGQILFHPFSMITSSMLFEAFWRVSAASAPPMMSAYTDCIVL